VLIGRDAELGAVSRFIDDSLAGAAALLVEGEAGIGKTALWSEAVGLASERGFRVLAARAAEAEASLSFAALAELLATVEQSRLDVLPDPQRRALEIALVHADPGKGAPARRAYSTAVLSLVQVLAADAPVLVAVDDLQWLDAPSAAVLAFVARRLTSQRVGLLLTARPDRPLRVELQPDTIPTQRLRLAPLSAAAIYQLIKARLGLTLTRPVVLRVQQASAGNPFFALELAAALGADATVAAGEALPLSPDLRELVDARIASLPARTRHALSAGAALARPTLGLVEQLAGEGAVGPAEKAGIVEVRPGGRLAFAHPLYAAAVQARESGASRRALHKRLSEHVTDPEERARHLALSAEGHDERVAELIETAADRVRRRGAPEVAAELAEQAVQLTPPELAPERARRTLAAAEHHFHAGEPARAQELLAALRTELDAASADGVEATAARASTLRLLGEMHYRDTDFQAAAEYLRASVQAAGDDLGLRALAEVELAFAFVAMAEFAQARAPAHAAVAAAEELGEQSLLAVALAVSTVVEFLLGEGLDEERLARALKLEDLDRAQPIETRPSFIAGALRLYRSELDCARAHLEALRRRLGERGEESDLPFVLSNLAWAACLSGELESAGALADEALQLAEQSGNDSMMAFALAQRALVDAQAGLVDSAGAAAFESIACSERAGIHVAKLWAATALGLLRLSLGDAVGAAEVLGGPAALVEAEGLREPIRAFFLPDAIEALLALGQLERAACLTTMLEECGRRLDRPWALALGGRCHALVAGARGDLDAAAEALEGALGHHERLRQPFELGRTLLVQGQLERRRKHKRQAREALERAHALFEQLGARLWAERAQAELERVAPQPAGLGQLTPTQARVAALAAAGSTNREVAGELFMSPKTVEAHLALVYQKLGIHSRAELGARLAATTFADTK
jgi:ATP/maltotriose-dependent transcriptional regulator MalT